MSEWWTYSLTDFLLFAPETYQKLFASYNRAVWPAQLVAVALGIALLVPAWHRHRHFLRLALAILAAGWALSGWAFHLQRYATINWAATWFAAGFLLQAALLCAAAATMRHAPAVGGRSLAGTAMMTIALLYPLLAPLTGRPFGQAEVIGFAPDPTVLTTLGLLLILPPPWRWRLLPLPLVWSAIGGATLWAMDAPQALILPVAGLLTLALAFRPSRSAA
jgi:hypothetical protein